jgi:hypothetical protein
VKKHKRKGTTDLLPRSSPASKTLLVSTNGATAFGEGLAFLGTSVNSSFKCKGTINAVKGILFAIDFRKEDNLLG